MQGEEWDQLYPYGLRLRLRLRLGGGVGGSVLVATPGSVHSTCIELQLRLRLGGEWFDQFTWPRQAQYIVHSSSSFSSCHNIMSISRLDLYHSGAINRLQRSLRGS